MSPLYTYAHNSTKIHKNVLFLNIACGTNYMTTNFSTFTVITKYLVDHGPDSGYQLIEPVDGFHPNQVDLMIKCLAVYSIDVIIIIIKSMVYSNKPIILCDEIWRNILHRGHV